MRQPFSEEKVSSLFEPDILLPCEYFDVRRRKLPLEPEKRLMLAVLEDAIWCYQKYMFTRDNKGKTLFREVEDWILEEEDDGVFSFANICAVVGFNPDYVRRGFATLKAKRVAHRRQTGFAAQIMGGGCVI